MRVRRFGSERTKEQLELHREAKSKRVEVRKTYLDGSQEDHLQEQGETEEEVEQRP